MLKNITLSAEEALIERARQRAEAGNTTLNAEFRALMAHINYARPGKVFSREELNER